MELNQILILCVAAFFSSTISSLAGFGGGIIMIVAFSFFGDIKETLVLCSLAFTAQNTNKAWLYRHTVDWPFARLVLYGAMPACVLGLLVFKLVPERPLEIFLGLLSLYLILEHYITLPKLKDFTPLKIILGGALWGFSAGAANGMPIKVMLLKWKGFTKHLFVGTSASLSWFVDFFKIPAYVGMGFLVFQDIIFWLPLFFVISFCGTWLGKWILGHTSVKGFETIMLIMIFLGAMKFLFL